MTCPKDALIDRLAGDVSLELWSWCLQPLPRIGRWDLQIARMDVRGLSNEFAVDLVTKLDRPGRKEDPSDDAMVPANPILFPSSGSIPPQQIFANADPQARIQLTRGFVSTPAVIAVTLAPSRRAAGLRRTDAPKLPQACCGSL